MTKKLARFTNFFEGSLTIFCTAIFAALALIIWFCFHLVAIEKYKIQTALEMESTRLERGFADRVDHTFALIKNINSQIAKNPQNKNYVNAVLEKFRTTPELSDTFSWTIFSWSNTENKIIVDANYGVMKEPFDLSSRDYMPLTKSLPLKFHLGEPVLGSTSKTWMIPGGVGALDKNGQYIGATTIGFGLDSLARSLHQAIQNQNIAFELFDEKGYAILHADKNSFGDSNMQKNQDRAIEIMLEKAKANKSGIDSDIHFFNGSHAFLVKKLNNFPYFVVLKYDKKELKNQIWQAFISRSIEIFFLFFISAILLTIIYKKERAQKEKILALKRLIEKTSEAKNEFIFDSSQEFKNFVFKIQSCAQSIKSDLKDKGFEKDVELSNSIIHSSRELADFIDNMIELSKKESIEFAIDANDHQADILRIVKRSVKLLETIADSSNLTLIKKIEDTLHQLSEIEPNKVKQIIINLMPNHKNESTSVKVEIHNDNDEKCS